MQKNINCPVAPDLRRHIYPATDDGIVPPGSITGNVILENTGCDTHTECVGCEPLVKLELEGKTRIIYTVIPLTNILVK